jgi:hypothetical protein
MFDLHVTLSGNEANYSRAPVYTDSVSTVHRSPKKNWKLNKRFVSFKTRANWEWPIKIVKSSSPNTPKSWLIFFCPRTHASPQNFPPFCFYRSHCSHYLPRYRTVCVQKAAIYQLNFTVFMYLFLYVGPAVPRLMYCSLPRLIVLTPLWFPPFISKCAPRQMAWETISERWNFGREMTDQCRVLLLAA